MLAFPWRGGASSALGPAEPSLNLPCGCHKVRTVWQVAKILTRGRGHELHTHDGLLMEGQREQRAGGAAACAEPPPVPDLQAAVCCACTPRARLAQCFALCDEGHVRGSPERVCRMSHRPMPGRPSLQAELAQTAALQAAAAQHGELDCRQPVPCTAHILIGVSRGHARNWAWRPAARLAGSRQVGVGTCSNLVQVLPAPVHCVDVLVAVRTHHTCCRRHACPAVAGQP